MIDKPLANLILFILDFSLLNLIRFARGLSIIFILIKEPAFSFVDSFMTFLASFALILNYIFIISPLLVHVLLGV
jgi:hypothetical protein